MTDTISHNGVIIHLFDTCLKHTVTNTIFKVNDQTTIIHLVLPSESIKRYACGSCNFTIDFEPIQEDAVITRACGLGFMTIWRSNAKSRQIDISDNRHQGNIS